MLPEISALDGVEQNRYHDRDVLGHTLEVLEEAIALERDPGPVLGAEHADALRAVLAEPLADGLPRSMGLRWGALLHDAAKPATRVMRDDGEVGGFPGHDVQGADLARDVLSRLKASERLRAHVAALTRHHLRLGFLVHSRPLDAHDLYGYLTATEPVEVDVTLLSVADRLATRGRKSEEAIERHVELAREVLPAILAWRAAGGRPAPLLRGDKLATAPRRRPRAGARPPAARAVGGPVRRRGHDARRGRRARAAPAQRVLSRSTTPSTTPTASRTERKSTLSGVSVGAW